MVEANEFYELSLRYNVSSVPQTNINDGEGVILGAVPEAYMLKELARAVQVHSVN